MNQDTAKPQVSQAQAWLGAMRLRTLPLALASTLTGSFLAVQSGELDWCIFSLTALTTILLQINSNLANDYGDFRHGADNDTRIGPERALQSGVISQRAMKGGIVLFSLLSLVCGSLLLCVALIPLVAKAALFVAGVAAIYASLRYTAGRNPYGYRGLGDASVMVFFGLLGVTGAYYLQTASLDPRVLLPAVAIGCFSAGVLNINNIRDMESDRNSGKITLAVRMGAERARVYHLLLLATGLDALLIYGWLSFTMLTHWFFLMAYPLFFVNMYKVYTVKDPKQLDPWLKQLALTTFLLAVLLAVGILIP